MASPSSSPSSAPSRSPSAAPSASPLTAGGLAGLAPLGAADDASTSGADCGINGAALAESGRGDDGGGERETSAGWMDAAERAARGFSADETVVMPLPNFDDCDDDD